MEHASANSGAPGYRRSGDWVYTLTETGNILILAYEGSEGEVNVPASLDGRKVTSIGENAFAVPLEKVRRHQTRSGNLSGITGITLPESVVSIGSGAFAYCDRLAQVSIPASVTSICCGTFLDCTALTEIRLPVGLALIDNGAFSGCSALKDVSIPDSVVTVEDYAFHGCTSLKTVSIGKQVARIGGGAFQKCTALKSVDVHPENPAYTSFEGALFNKELTTLLCCPAGKEGAYFVPGGVKCIGQLTFDDDTLIELVISSEYHAFGCCVGLTSIHLPHSILALHPYSFEGCANLQRIDVDSSNPAYAGIDGVLFDKKIETLLCYPRSKAGAYSLPDTIHGYSAFRKCTGLTEITVPDGVTEIDFNECANLKSVKIGSGVLEISGYAFEGCTNLGRIDVDSRNPAYASEDGVLFDKDRTKLLLYPRARRGEYTIPDSVVSIGEPERFDRRRLVERGSGAAAFKAGHAFRDCVGLTMLKIPDSVLIIGGGAFRGWRGCFVRRSRH